MIDIDEIKTLHIEHMQVLEYREDAPSAKAKLAKGWVEDLQRELELRCALTNTGAQLGGEINSIQDMMIETGAIEKASNSLAAICRAAYDRARIRDRIARVRAQSSGRTGYG